MELATRRRSVRKSILPGFGLTMGCTLAYLGLLVLLPLSLLFVRAGSLGWGDFWNTIASERTMAAFTLSFGASLAAAVLNAGFGLIVAWVLVRYTFPGRAILDALVDLPFALPTAVAGIALTTLYSVHGWLGRCLVPLGIKVAYTPLGVMIALTFVGLPFVVRTLQPVIREIDPEVEEVAISLGARRWQVFMRVIMPAVLPALLTGFAMAFARALGEYGSVVFISGNMPMRTEIAPLLIMTKLEEYDYAGAAAIAAAMLAMSFILLLCINVLQWWSRRNEAD